MHKSPFQDINNTGFSMRWVGQRGNVLSGKHLSTTLLRRGRSRSNNYVHKYNKQDCYIDERAAKKNASCFPISPVSRAAKATARTAPRPVSSGSQHGGQWLLGESDPIPFTRTVHGAAICLSSRGPALIKGGWCYVQW